MDNPQPERRPHPLERRPTPPPEQPPRQQVILHIPSVRPTVTYALVLLNIAIFALRALSPEVDASLFLWGANHPPDVLVGGEYYRLLSSMFLHASIYDFLGGFAPANSLHLIFNMYILYAVGTSLERLFGHARFLIVYLLGGLTGSILSTLLGSFESYSVGASGAVFAVLGAEFVYLHHHRRLMGEAGRARRQSLITFGIVNLLFGLASSLPGSAMRIDNWAHIGGLTGGMALAWFISPILTLKMHPDYPGEILGEDTNPLGKRYWVVSVYATVLVVLVFIGVFLARR
ncbi:MAG: rhomboid family intramembrane serine protease [Chloroflexi bacterium]|nr:rhomboid family intramembrane serine protease [Chloroflexota bacterium]MDL1882603.1 rhomboid family intramembrane serine protease [Anaerolineae bacterium CFX8]